MFHIIFYEPRIPANTGNAIRMTAATGATLHLIEPLGFEIDDKHLKRAGLDYHELSKMEVHKNLESCIKSIKPTKVYAFTAHAKTFYTKVDYPENTALLFGPEPFGLPEKLLINKNIDKTLRIPMLPGRRSLNLSNAACLVTYEAWRQNDFFNAQ